jgi:hypothetical protein
MTVNELSEKYAKELSGTKGDKEMRYYLLAPLFKNLYQNKIVYHERFTALVQLSNISLTPDMFTARAELISVIRTLRTQRRPVPQTWEISANWKYLTLNKGCLSPYSSWLIWPDPELVKKVENLINTNKLEEAYEISMGQF